MKAAINHARFFQIILFLIWLLRFFKKAYVELLFFGLFLYHLYYLKLYKDYNFYRIYSYL